VNDPAGRYRAVTAALAATVLIALAGLVLTGLEWGSLATSDAVGSVGTVAGSIAYAALGALIVRRAGNLVGWFMLAEGAATAVMTTGSAYAIFGVKAHPGTLPARPRPGRWPRPSSCSWPWTWPRSSWSSRPGGCPRPAGAGRAGRPGADRPDAGLVRGQHAAGGPARGGRHLAGPIPTRSRSGPSGRSPGSAP
jgi:hypothetical protein